MHTISRILDSLRASPRRRGDRIRRASHRRRRLDCERLEPYMLLTAVTTALDSGPGSLRVAIVEAMSSPFGDHVITNDIPEGMPTTIDLLSPLPVITSNLTIGGLGIAGFLEIDGDGLPSPGLVFAPGSDGSVLSSIAINRFNGPGISVESNHDEIEGCYIGTDSEGAVALPNTGDGIDVIGHSNLISSNVISGNDGHGVAIYGPNAYGNAVANGNLIGVDPSGVNPLGNGGTGVAIFGGANGGTVDGNVISANAGYGISIDGSENYSIGLNRIGVGANGEEPLGNGGTGIAIFGNSNFNSLSGNVICANAGYGISVDGSSLNSIDQNNIGVGQDGETPLGNAATGIAIFGGSSYTSVDSNVVSDNGAYGISVADPGTVYTAIQSNLIGTDASGTQGFGNVLTAISVFNGAEDTTIGSLTGQGNLISGNLSDGIDLYGQGTNGNYVAGNKIGTEISGGSMLGNLGSGVAIGGGSSLNTVVGNVISGNGVDGVDIFGQGTSGNGVAGNDVGLSADGMTQLPNTYQGVAIFGGATGNTIGGTTAAAGNVITGNGTASTSQYFYANLAIYGAGTSSNLVEGNDIGTNADNASGLDAPYTFGAFIGDGATNNIIGGTVAGSGNVISGNTGDGVVLANPGTSNNWVAGNYIGVDSSGENALPNSLDGLVAFDGASNNTFGGTTAGAGNIIAFNGGNGVQVGENIADDSTGNAILENSIFANAKLGIDLGDESSPTGTPVGSPPSGPNNLQNAPVLTTALDSGSSTTVSGTLSAAINTTFRIEFFSNPTGTSQGETFLGFLDVTTNASGLASFSFSPSSLVETGLNITATATDPNGNSSEFSAPATVQSSPINVTGDLSVKYGGFVYNRAKRQFTQTLTITNTSGAAITGPIELVLFNLKNASLLNQSGTYQGNPYVTVLSSGSLGAGQSVTITLVFNDPTLATITYTSEFFAGPLP